MHSRRPVNTLYLMKDKCRKKENNFGDIVRGEVAWGFAQILAIS